jgi:hypothetical protein
VSIPGNQYVQKTQIQGADYVCLLIQVHFPALHANSLQIMGIMWPCWICKVHRYDGYQEEFSQNMWNWAYIPLAKIDESSMFKT